MLNLVNYQYMFVIGTYVYYRPNSKLFIDILCVRACVRACAYMLKFSLVINKFDPLPHSFGGF